MSVVAVMQFPTSKAGPTAVNWDTYCRKAQSRKHTVPVLTVCLPVSRLVSGMVE